MFEVGFREFSVSVQDGELPLIYSEYVNHASFSIELDIEAPEGRAGFCAVARGNNWPFCVLSFRYVADGGFTPGVLIVPTTEILFLGAGTLLLAIDLQHQKKLWEDEVECGFWSWHQEDDYVLMSAELELAAWTTRGKKKWSTFVEPPWDYKIRDGIVILDVMGNESKFPLLSGPTAT